MSTGYNLPLLTKDNKLIEEEDKDYIFELRMHRQSLLKTKDAKEARKHYDYYMAKYKGNISFSIVKIDSKTNKETIVVF